MGASNDHVYIDMNIHVTTDGTNQDTDVQPHPGTDD